MDTASEQPVPGRSSQATHDNVAFRYLSADQHPDHDTLAAFRQQHLEALAGLFVQALRLCQKAGLVKLGNVAIDWPTKIKANASTRPLGRLREDQRTGATLAIRSGAITEPSAANRSRRRPTVWRRPTADPLPDDLASAQKRLQRLQQARTELEQEAKEQLQAAVNDPSAAQKPVAPTKPNKPARRRKVGSSAIRRRSAAFELQRMPLRRVVNITSSMLTRG